MPVNQTLRVRWAWPLLVCRATTGRPPFTYGELCRPIGLHHRAAQWFLGVIQDYCRLHRLPRLQALAVNKRTRLPGRGYDGPRTIAGHSRDLERVRRYRWPKRAPF
jgi:hypothetical protein